MRTYCFVIQQLRTSESDVNVPSGTLTVVHELVKHWGEGRVILLCNHEYGNFPFLEKLRDKYGVDLHANPVLTVQDRRARLVSAGARGVGLLIRMLAIRILAPVYIARTILYLRGYLVANGVDVIYSHSGGYPGGNLNLLAILAGRLAGIRNAFLISHNVPSPVSAKRRPFSFVQDRVISRAAKGILSVSEAAARSHEQMRLFGRRVGWIHNGITLAAGKEPVAPVPCWRRAGVPIIMFLGILAPRKGLDVLMRALSEVRRGWTLVLYGSGALEYTAALKSLVAQLRLEDRVVFAGFEPKASRFLRYCDFLVLPSTGYESFGMVILEAMRHEKAVICSDFGGMKEVVEHGRTGLVVPSGDSAKLGAAIQHLLDDPAAAHEMGARGHRRLLERFDIRSTVEQYKALVE